MVKQKIQAFTLVELIVVITILAILGTIAFISLQGYSADARDSTRISDLSSMKSSLELFHLDAGKYPMPTAGVDITYSGATVWSQGTFGETVFANVDRLDKIPTDPLTEKEYTYSVTSTKNQYQLGGMVEGDSISYIPLSQPFLPREKGVDQFSVPPRQWGEGLGGRDVFAGTTEAQAYITGNYNEQMTKSLSGTTCNVLALPSIIVNDTTNTNLEQIVASGSLVYRGYKNLPSSYKGSKFKQDGGFNFVPNTIIAYTDNHSCEPLTDKTVYTARVNLLKGLQNAYSGTIVQNEGELKNILALSIDVNNISQEVVAYAGNYINNTMGAKIDSGGTKVSYTNCTSGTQNGYNYGALNHYQSQNVTKTGSITNGMQSYGAQANCSNGTINITDEAVNITCNSGYVEQTGTCVADVCGNTVPSNAHSTATSQTVSQTWTRSASAGVCTFDCDTHYTWNGSSCIADTQSTSCTGKPANSIWNTASIITQTWNGTIWTPSESPIYNTSASTTSCRYTCDSGYHTEDAGINCISNTRSCAITNGTGEETWNGSGWGTCTVVSCDTDFYEVGNMCTAVGNGYFSAAGDLIRTVCTNNPDTASRDYTYTSDGNGTNSCTATYSELCGLDLYETSNGVCSSVGNGYYSANLSNTRTACTNNPDTASRDYTYTSPGNGTNSCAATYSELCGLDLYETSNGVCSSVGNGYYSANLSNTRTACTNKPVNSTYTGDGNGTNNCTFSCNSGYTWNGSSCVTSTYTVTFNANGGTTPSPSTKVINMNNAVGTLATTTYNGYDFLGWYTAPTGGSLISTSTIVTGNVTYYAQWEWGCYWGCGEFH